MIIVILYTNTDGYTYSFTGTVPIEYESLEAAIVDFELAYKSHKDGRFTFANVGFDSYDFEDDRGKYLEPEFKTVDEWVNYYKR